MALPKSINKIIINNYFKKGREQMDKMSIKVIMKSGVGFTIKCEKITIKRDMFGKIVGWEIEGISENKPVYIDFEEIAAVIRL